MMSQAPLGILHSARNTASDPQNLKGSSTRCPGCRRSCNAVARPGAERRACRSLDVEVPAALSRLQMIRVQILALQGEVARARVRDTALYAPLMSRHPVSGKLRSRRLRHVVLQELGISIQDGEHDPAQDARAALYVYHKHKCAPWPLA